MARPREFDIDSALERAMELFWEKGYDGATLPDLTATMGISRPSLYAAFGDKQALFRRVLDRYAAGPAGYVREALAAPTARAAAERLLRRTIDLVTGRRPPRVCLFVRGALTWTRRNGCCVRTAARKSICKCEPRTPRPSSSTVASASRWTTSSAWVSDWRGTKRSQLPIWWHGR